MNKDIYINKIYYDIATYLKVKKVNDYGDGSWNLGWIQK